MAEALRIDLPNNWTPRPDQEPLWEYLHGGGKRAIEVAHRRWGKDDVALHFTACAVHERVGVYWHLLPQHNQSRKAIWDAVNPHTGKRRIDEAFPRELRETTREVDMAIRFKNGSLWQVIGSDNYDALVGTPPVGVVFSEWALSDPQAWSMIRPILAENGGWTLFITTPRGRNHAHRMYEMAKTSPDWFCQTLTVDDTEVFADDVLEREKAELIHERGEEDGLAIYEQEYMCSWSAALPGAYYARQIDKLEREGSLTKVPWNPARQVHTAWDLGANDQTVIWFVQWTGATWNFIDYIAGTSKGIPEYVTEVRQRPYIYGEHLVPHDAGNKEKALPNAATIADTMGVLGLEGVRVVARTNSVANDINEARKLLPICMFDAEKCAHGIDALRSYRREWDDKLRNYRDKPYHDWASDPADAFRTFAMGRPQERDLNDNEEWPELGGNAESAGGY
jgi:phage terminase large subunit